jgi:phytanoyl-CoA dioxygenase PhyH
MGSVVGQRGRSLRAHAPVDALSQVLALRVHLDDSRAEPGPLRVLPATHKLGILSDDAMRLLAAQVAPVDGLVPRGGVLAMKPLLVHASSKSPVAVPRRVLHIEYAASTNTRPRPFWEKDFPLASEGTGRRFSRVHLQISCPVDGSVQVIHLANDGSFVTRTASVLMA